MREGFDVSFWLRRAVKQRVTEQEQYDEWHKARKAKNVYSGRPDCRRKQETMLAYELSTEKLNGLLEAATPVATAAVGVRTEGKVNAVYGMSGGGDTNRDTLEIGKA